MENKTDTKVIFRKWVSNGDVIALFPEIAATAGKPFYCLSYEHIGQHGAASPDIVCSDLTSPAKPEEYAALKSELESIGYKLKVIARFSQAHYRERVKQLA